MSDVCFQRSCLANVCGSCLCPRGADCNTLPADMARLLEVAAREQNRLIDEKRYIDTESYLEPCCDVKGNL